jgi:hypothetical protein
MRPSRPLRHVVSVAIACAALAATTGSLASDAREDSRAAFRRGVDQAQAGDYKGARESFALAYKLYPHPSILLNLGIARAKTGEYIDAEQDLIRFLSDDGGAPPNELVSARTVLAEVRAHLGSFRLRVSPSGASARLDSRPLALIPGKLVEVRATVGTHALHVDADGFTPTDRTIPIDSASTRDVEVALDSSPNGAARGGAPVADARSGSAATTAGFILVGSAVVLAGVGTYAGLHARSLASDYNTPGSGAFQDAPTRSSGITFRTLADVTFASALIAGGIGVYFLVSAPRASSVATTSPHADTSRVRAHVVVGPVFSGVAGTF